MKVISLTTTLLTLLIACGGGVRKEPRPEARGEPDAFSSYRAYDHFVKGDLYERSGNLGAAAEEYRKALIYDPASSEIRRILSNVYFEMKRFNEAAVLRSEITDKSVDDYNFIGGCLRRTRDFSGAADFYRRSLEIDSTQCLPRIYLARLLQVLGNNNEAEKHYEAAVEFAADRVASLLDLGSFYAGLPDYDKALDAYRRALDENPDDIRPALRVASVLFTRGDTTGADSIYILLAEKNWNNPAILQSLVPLFFSLYDGESAEWAAGRIAELLPHDRNAQKYYGFILFGNQKFSEAESVLVALDQSGMADSDIYYYLGRMRQNDEDFAAAEKYFSQALALEDTVSDTWLNLALVVDEQGRYEDALDVMKRAMQKVPRDSTAIMFYTSLIHSRNEKYELALDGHLRLLDSDPENAQYRFNLAASYERLGRYQKAEHEFVWIIERSPDNALALNYLGYMYADQGIKLDEALEMIEKAVSLDPENGAYLDSYAWVLYKLGKYEEALIQMKNALKYETGDSILYDHLGDIYEALNDNKAAKESWAKALELDPDNEEIRLKLNSR